MAIDAGKVNTRDGWRDVKLAVISKRKPGLPATPDEWDTRALPTPTIRTVVAAIEGVDAFTPRVRTETDRLGVTTAPALSVLADGAEWIWNLASLVLPTATGVLDIDHALEHVSAPVTMLNRSESDATRLRAAGTRALVSGGKAGIEQWIGETLAAVPHAKENGKEQGPLTEGLLTLAAYLANHPTHLDYAGRLGRGESIGSGQVEGAIKELVNLRLKRTGARWTVAHVGPLVELLALSDAPEWHHFRTAA